MEMRYPTIEDQVGRTPLIVLQRLEIQEYRLRKNVVLAKLEGNNPAGWVKDRPALSMIHRAKERGQIHPGDTLIEAIRLSARAATLGAVLDWACGR